MGGGRSKLCFCRQPLGVHSGVEAGDCLAFRPWRDHSQPLSVRLRHGGSKHTKPVRQKGGGLSKARESSFVSSLRAYSHILARDSASSFFGARAESP